MKLLPQWLGGTIGEPSGSPYESKPKSLAVFKDGKRYIYENLSVPSDETDRLGKLVGKPHDWPPE